MKLEPFELTRVTGIKALEDNRRVEKRVYSAINGFCNATFFPCCYAVKWLVIVRPLIADFERQILFYDINFKILVLGNN